MRREIAQFCAFPVTFRTFYKDMSLTDGALSLVCEKYQNAIPEKNYVPSYYFALLINGQRIGSLNLRVGYNESLYYSGNLGYQIDPDHRGQNYAARACRLLIPLARAHQMRVLGITNEYTNDASRRVCEKLGARQKRIVKLPEEHPLRKDDGQLYDRIFWWYLVEE